MVDRHTGELRQDRDRGLVFVAELPAAHLFSQVQVSDRLAAGDDAHPEERFHRRVARGKAERARVRADVGQTLRRGPAGQHPEHTVSARTGADAPAIGVFETDGYEPLKLTPSIVEHPQCGIPRARKFVCGLQHPRQHRLDVEIAKNIASDIQHCARRGITQHTFAHLYLLNLPHL